jgi:hypothetical protein
MIKTVNPEMEAAAKEAERLYGDILYMEHPVSGRHHPAPRTSRAAQFSPFAALTGYDDVIRETARLTDEKPELSEEQKQHLDEVIAEVMNSPEAKRVMITYFQSDERKQGGSFASVTTTIRKAGSVYLETAERKKIPLEDIIDLIEASDEQ